GRCTAEAPIVHDSARDWWRSLDAVFLPQSVYPSQFFVSANSWRFLLQGSIPVFDSGQRTSLRGQRQPAVDAAQPNLTGAVTQAASQVRVAREAVASGER